MFAAFRSDRWRGPRGALAAVQGATIALLLLSGFVFVGVVVANRTGPLSLVAVTDAPVSFFLRLRSLALFAGIFLVLSGLAALAALLFTSTRSTLGRSLHVVLVLACFLFVFVIALVALVARGRNDVTATRDDMLAIWTSAVSSNADNQLTQLCKLESKYSCRGFQDFDCVGCVLGREAACAPEAGNAGDRCAPCGIEGRDPADGCWNDLYLALRATYLAVGVSCVLLAGTILALLVATAVLWGRSDKFEAKTLFDTCDVPRSPNMRARVSPKNISSIPRDPPRELPYVL